MKRKNHLRAGSLAAIMAGSGILHFVATDSYARIVPHLLGNPRLWVELSGLAELACGGLLAVPRTRRVGGLATAALLLAVFPANVQMAVDGGVHGAGFPLDSATVAWLRLPIQVPLIYWAWRVSQARSGQDR